MKIAKAIAARLKEMREAAGLSQQEVAVKADLSLSLVAKMEQGKKADPRASTLLALAAALGVKPGAILEDLLPPAAAEAVEAAEGPAKNGAGEGGLPHAPPSRKKKAKKAKKAKKPKTKLK